MNLTVLRLSAKSLYVLASLFLSLFIFQNASAQSCVGNLIYNPGFEKAFESRTIGGGWEGIGGTSFSNDARSGQRAISMSVSDYRRIWQFFPAQPGEDYTASAFLKSNTSGTIGMKFLTADYQPDNLLTSVATNGNYTRVEIKRTAPVDAAWIEISIYSNANEVVLADDFCLAVGDIEPNNCQISRTLSNFICDNNGTNNDPLDDTFSFSVNGKNAQSNGTYNLEIPSTGQRQTLSYNSPTRLSGFPVFGGDVELNFIDSNDPTCVETLTALAIPSCSGEICPGNLLIDASFEGNTSNRIGWENTASLSSPDGIQGEALLVRKGRQVWQYQRAEPGKEYTVNGFLKTDTEATMGLKFLDASYQRRDNHLISTTTSGRYQQLEITKVAPAFAAWVEVSIYGGLNSQVLADDFCLTTGDVSAGVDLEITATLGNPSPDQWSVFTTTVTVTNTGDATATGVEVEFDPSLSGAVYQGGNAGRTSQGTFRSWRNNWEVGSLAPGQSATLDVNLFRLLPTQFAMYTQVVAQNEADEDSAPNNGVCCTLGEDDDQAILVQAASANNVNNRSSIVKNLGNQPFAIVNTMPNPFTEEFKLQVFSNENQESEITVMNSMGQAVFKKSVYLNEGMNTISVDLNDGISGILMVKMTPFHPYLRQIRVMKVRD